MADGALSTVAAPLTEVVDATGAGDALAGVYLASRLQRLAPERALGRAGAAASLSCRESDAPARISTPRASTRFSRRRRDGHRAGHASADRAGAALRRRRRRRRALAAGGFSGIELTMSTPGVPAAVPPLAAAGLLVGVGTIRSADEVEPAIAAGARFLVSYWNQPGFVAAASAAGVPAVPGGLTPSEIAATQLDRPAAVKLFPATLVTPGYVRTLLVLDPSLRLLVTGGIEPSPSAIAPWFEAGASMVGIGGALGTGDTVGAAEVERRGRAALEASRR